MSKGTTFGKLSRLPDDPQYRVDGLPRQIRAKTTQLIDASRKLAFVSNLAPHERHAIREEYLKSRYNLEQTIKTLLDKG